MSLPSFLAGSAVAVGILLIAPAIQGGWSPIDALVGEEGRSPARIEASIADAQRLAPLTATQPALLPAPASSAPPAVKPAAAAPTSTMAERAQLTVLSMASTDMAPPRPVREAPLYAGYGVLPGEPQKVLSYDLYAWDQGDLDGTYHAFCTLSDGWTTGQVIYQSDADEGGLYTSVSSLNRETNVAVAVDRFCEAAQARGDFNGIAPLPSMARHDFDSDDADELSARGIPVSRDARMLHFLNLPLSKMPPAVDISGIEALRVSDLAPGAPERIVAQYLHDWTSSDGDPTTYWTICSQSNGQVTGTIAYTSPTNQSGQRPSVQLSPSAVNDEITLYLAAQKQCERVLEGLKLASAPALTEVH